MQTFTGSKIGFLIYIKHLGDVASAAIFSHYFQQFPVESHHVLFWHSMANLHYLSTSESILKAILLLEHAALLKQYQAFTLI